MIILNQTFIIDEHINNEWLTWITDNYMPDVMATGFFTAYRLLTVLDSPNEGMTYCLQFTTRDLMQYREFATTEADLIKNTHLQKFENKFVLFETIMQLVDEI